jgi:hypothetical protein
MSKPVTQCAWCDRYLVGAVFSWDFDAEFAALIRGNGVTHGICPDCLEDMNRERIELLSGENRRSTAGQQADRNRAGGLQREASALSTVQSDSLVSR